MATRTKAKTPSGDQKVAQESGSAKGGESPPARREETTARTRPRLLPEERRRLIAEMAYFIAERRGFAAGWELDDWLRAEAEVNRKFGESRAD